MTLVGTHSNLCDFFAREALPPFEQTGWDDFRNRFSTPAADLAKPLSELPADYSRGTVASSWRDTACKIGRIVLMIILFPWGLYAGTKYLFQRLIMTIVFPLQSDAACFKPYKREILDRFRQRIQPNLNRTHIVEITPGTFIEGMKSPYLVRQIILEKEGRRYRALMIVTAHSLKCRNWVLHAPGNGIPIEYCAEHYARYYTQDQNANLLIVQGPGAGGNDGEVPTTDLGEPCELALSCIETHFKAKNIILSGHSLGGASIGQAIKQHTFNTKKYNYIVVRQMTFDSTGNMGYRWVGFNKWFTCSCLGRMAEWLVKWTDCHIDNVEASRILQEKQIVEIIIQAGEDEVIPQEAFLSQALQAEGITGSKLFEFIPNARHAAMSTSLTPLLQKHPCGVAFLNQSC